MKLSKNFLIRRTLTVAAISVLGVVASANSFAQS